MPNPLLRVVLAISALIAALMMAGVGAGVAGADPDDPPPHNPSETAPPADPTPVNEPQSTTADPPSIFDIPRTIAGQLRDLVGRPLSIFGNGRVPGTHTAPDATTHGSEATTAHNRDKPAVDPVAPVLKTVEPVEAPAPFKPVRRFTSAVDVTLPYSAPISIPVPDIPVPGYETMRWTLNLTDPYTASASVQNTLTTVNSLLSDALAPYNPFQPPPRPQPTFRTFEEEPVVDAGGSGSAMALSDASPQLPVLQAPVVIPPIRIARPRPAIDTAPAAGQVSGAGGAGVPAPAIRGEVAQAGAPPPGQLPPNGSTSAVSNSGLGNATVREGYPRPPRMNQLATVAIPGLAGLIALTASGGVIGYRQANSGRYLRSDAARFMQ